MTPTIGHGLSAGGSWIRTFSSALDRQRFRGFVRVGSIYRRPGHPSTCRPRHTIELSRDGPRSRHSPRIRQRRRCKRIAEPNPRRSWEAVTPSRLDQQPAVLRGTESLLTLCWREMDSNLYGAFPVKRSFSIYCQFFVRSGKGPFFVPSPPIRFPERAMGSRDRNASKALAPWRLAALVFGSALTA